MSAGGSSPRIAFFKAVFLLIAIAGLGLTFDRYSTSYDQAQEQIEILEKEKVYLKKEVTKYQTQAETLDKNVADLTTDESKKQIASLEEKVELIEGERDSYKEKLDAAEVYQRNVTDYLSTTIDQFTALKEEHETTKKELKEKDFLLTNLKTEHATRIKDDHADASKENNKRQSDIVQAHGKLGTGYKEPAMSDKEDKVESNKNDDSDDGDDVSVSHKKKVYGLKTNSTEVVRDNNDSHREHCQVEKLDFPFRTVTIQRLPPTPSYKIFLYGPGKDMYISDTAFNSNGNETFEMHIQALMEHQLKDRVPHETVILDIGANIGTHALNLASKGFIVHAFEPSTDNFNLLQCSKVANQFDNLILNNYGLSNEDAKLCLDIKQGNHGHAVLNAKKDDCGPDVDKVVVKRLDDYFENTLKGKSPYIIKIDVEGHEMLAFEGGVKMLENDPPKLIFIEIMWLKKKQFVDFFWSYDYTIYLANGMKKIERGPISDEDSIFKGQLDAILVHSSIDVVT